MIAHSPDSPAKSIPAISPFAPHSPPRQVRIGAANYTVYLRELPAPSGTRALALVFESEGVIRIVRGFPETWHTLSDEELAALSWQR